MQIGDGTTTNRLSPVQVLTVAASPLTGVLQIAAGEGHTCVVMATLYFRCWGYNSYVRAVILLLSPCPSTLNGYFFRSQGQLGNGNTVSLLYAPAADITTAGTLSWIAVSSLGFGHTCGSPTPVCCSWLASDVSSLN